MDRGSENFGKVFLIGAGPGDLELLTLKAVKMIRQADLLLLDDLVNPAVVTFAKPTAVVRRVGKRGGQLSTPQQKIDRQIIEAAKDGLTVARIKGGDPFVFGRGGEELESLRAEGLEVEVVNGITSGLAAASALGIAVTHRDYAHSVTFVTGHDTHNVDWSNLAASGSTLVIYMGLQNVESIARMLISGGLAEHTPVAIVQNATLPQERTAVCSLFELGSIVRQYGFESPSIIMIGGAIRASQERSQLTSELLLARAK